MQKKRHHGTYDKYACWFLLASEIIGTVGRGEPEQVIGKLKTEGWGDLPPLSP